MKKDKLTPSGGIPGLYLSPECEVIALVTGDGVLNAVSSTNSLDIPLTNEIVGDLWDNTII